MYFITNTAKNKFSTQFRQTSTKYHPFSRKKRSPFRVLRFLRYIAL